MKNYTTVFRKPRLPTKNGRLTDGGGFCRPFLLTVFLKTKDKTRGEEKLRPVDK